MKKTSIVSLRLGFSLSGNEASHSGEEFSFLAKYDAVPKLCVRNAVFGEWKALGYDTTL